MSDEPFKSTGLFKKYTIKNKIFQNREVLRHSYSPRELPHRVDQIDSIAVILLSTSTVLYIIYHWG